MMHYVGITLRLLLLLALVPACSTAASNSYCYETAPRSAKPAASPVEIWESAKVRRPYKVIGFVKTEAGKSSDTREIVAQLQAAARQLGGDALLDLSHGPANSAPPGPVFSHLRREAPYPPTVFPIMSMAAARRFGQRGSSSGKAPDPGSKFKVRSSKVSSPSQIPCGVIIYSQLLRQEDCKWPGHGFNFELLNLEL
jgi:hypothetical protein